MATDRPPGTPREFLLDCARFYRGLGFFATHANLADEALADELERIRRDEWQRDLEPGDVMDELVLAHWDEDRVWWEDAYEWLGDLDTMYTECLRGWARISRGTFRPTDIVETWTSTRGPVTVDFTMDGLRYRFAPVIDASVETVDTNLLGPINGLIAPSGLRFTAVDTTDQTSYLIVVSQAEREALARRGWPFQDWVPVAPPPRGFPPPPPRTAAPRAAPPAPPPKKKGWFSKK